MKRKQRDREDIFTIGDFLDMQQESAVGANSINTAREKIGADKYDPIIQQVQQAFSSSPELERQFFDNTELENVGESLFMLGTESKERMERMNRLTTGESGEGGASPSKSNFEAMEMGDAEQKFAGMTEEQRLKAIGEK